MRGERMSVQVEYINYNEVIQSAKVPIEKIFTK